MIGFAVISKINNIRQRPGFYQISLYLVDIILRENNIKIENGSKRDICFFIQIFNFKIQRN